MAGHPLRSATDRRFGGPLPRQLANQTRIHLTPMKSLASYSCELLVLCGISSRFQLLSPCVRQVIHALLTRPPLSHRTIIPEGNQVKCFVRLACVKHAASVHPEPGSNSHKKFFPFQNQLANFNHSLIPNVTVLGCFDFRLCCSLELI